MNDSTITSEELLITNIKLAPRNPKGDLISFVLPDDINVAPPSKSSDSLLAFFQFIPPCI